MITCETLVYLPFQPRRTVFSATASACNRSSIASARRSTSTARTRFATPTARSTPRSPTTRTRSITRSRPTRRSRIVRLLRSLGSRADANSGGEIQVALRAGFAPPDIVFTGVGKTRDELEIAIGKDVGTINAESAGELDRIADDRARPGPRRARGASRESRHRRAEAIRTSRPDSRATSSACRFRMRARSIASAARWPACSSSACTFTSARRSRRRSRCDARPQRSSRWRSICTEDGFHSSTSISAAGSASPTRAGR